ncbi:Hypothetical predicted protein [Mytilus galloprovincialis]|uniref:Uncharacterized protein n=1 Tax=Mytilus galloprovincialis TaxID=29158 RepID=A0A8B6D167_MYTGA|nr:Hypothetical predicted protein [Mytilus galloprovincialis]
MEYGGPSEVGTPWEYFIQKVHSQIYHPKDHKHNVTKSASPRYVNLLEGSAKGNFVPGVFCIFSI